MTYSGTVREGRVEFDSGQAPPDGTQVRVIPKAERRKQRKNHEFNLGEWLESARAFRQTLPLTEDSTEILRRIREERASR